MQQAPLPQNEAARLEDPARYEMLDTPSEEDFDELARLAATICGAPIAAIGLIDAGRQWFKSSVGLDRSETPRDRPLCAHTILQRDLLVEDSPDNRLLIVSYLKTFPYAIDVAEHGQVAVDKFRRNRYDLVLMDVQMPVMDGHSATRAIRRWEQEQGRTPTPIVALTANALPEEIRKSLEAGCTDHLIKPIKKATLLAAISEQARSVMR